MVAHLTVEKAQQLIDAPIITDRREVVETGRFDVPESLVVLVQREVAHHKRVGRVGVVQLLARRVHVDHERVANAPDQERLVEVRFALVVRQDADVAASHRRLAVGRGVVGDLCGAALFDVSNHALEDFGGLLVGG